MNSYSSSKSKSRILLTILLGIGALTMVVPFGWMLSTSFDWNAILNLSFPPRLFPEIPSFKAYYMAFTMVSMLRYLLNSFIIAAGVIAVSLLSALSAGYALSKIRFKGYNVLLIIALSTMMVPFEVTMIPQFFLFNKLGLINNYLAFFLPAVTYVFGTFFIKQYMDTIPDSFRESAIIDGANELQIAFKIFVPLCGPLVFTLVVLVFIGSWNDFLWPLIVLTDPNLYTVQLGVSMFTYNQGLNNMPAVDMAVAIVSSIPVLLIYMFFQKYIVESISMSGLKQ